MEDNSGIFEELQAERKELEELLKSAKNITRESVFLAESPFFTYEEHKDKMIISGVALAEGVWKNVLYPSEEIAKAAKDLEGKPLLVEHGQDEHFKDRKVGKVLKAYYDPVLKALVFQAEVTDPEAIKMVKEGKFPAVSCSTWLDKFPLNEKQAIGFNFVFNELSLVKSPACEKCFIFAVEELSKLLKKDTTKEALNIESHQGTQEVINMSAEKEEVIEQLEEEVDLTEVEPPKLYAVIEAESLSELPEDLAKKVVTYYYGYPYPYPYYGKYPYPHYPYYPYYPYPKPKKGTAKKPEKKSLWVVLEMSSPEEIKKLKELGKKVVAVYYGYYGYPYYGYPYYPNYGYPYYPYYPYYGYGYPTPKEGKKAKEKKGLAVTEEGEELEFNTLDELTELAKKKKIVAVYYGYPGYYPYYGYPYGEYGYYPYYPYYGYSYGYYPYYPYYGYPTLSEQEIDELIDSMDLAEDYKTFMKKCMKESKTMPVTKRMKECAEAFKKMKAGKEEQAKKQKECPPGQVWDEKEGKCVPIEGKEKYPVPASAAAEHAPPGGREFTDMEPGKLEVPSGPEEDAKKLASKVKEENSASIPTVENIKKEEVQVTQPVVEVSKEPCAECPKEEKNEAKVETKTETPVKEEPKVEEKKPEEKPVETKPAEVKEEKPVETKPAETPKETPKEERKEPTQEEIMKFLKENWPEILRKLAMEKKF